MRLVREEFGKGNDFCQKITYRARRNPEDILQDFRNSYFPRIAVTVDMIATGTDVRAIEILLFMRQVRSRGYFEQMRGRGTRIINSDELQAVTADAGHKTHFVLDRCRGPDRSGHDRAASEPRSASGHDALSKSCWKRSPTVQCDAETVSSHGQPALPFAAALERPGDEQLDRRYHWRMAARCPDIIHTFAGGVGRVTRSVGSS